MPHANKRSSSPNSRNESAPSKNAVFPNWKRRIILASKKLWNFASIGLVGIGSSTLLTLLLIYHNQAWHKHFFNQIALAQGDFLVAVGTTGLGWWVQSVIWFVLTESATFIVIWRVRGVAAVKAYASNFIIGFYVWLIVICCVYVPIFAWHAISRTYSSHESLVAAKNASGSGLLATDDARLAITDIAPWQSGDKAKPIRYIRYTYQNVGKSVSIGFMYGETILVSNRLLIPKEVEEIMSMQKAPVESLDKLDGDPRELYPAAAELGGPSATSAYVKLFDIRVPEDAVEAELNGKKLLYIFMSIFFKDRVMGDGMYGLTESCIYYTKASYLSHDCMSRSRRVNRAEVVTSLSSDEISEMIVRHYSGLLDEK